MVSPVVFGASSAARLIIKLVCRRQASPRCCLSRDHFLTDATVQDSVFLDILNFSLVYIALNSVAFYVIHDDSN